MNDKEQKNPFQNTLNLPRTEFSIRANAQSKEPEIIARWEQEDLFGKSSVKNKGNKKFVLHFGPPYANGHLHLGHALSYILKDIVYKEKRMAGHQVVAITGWDCHGLPIELKVTAEHDFEKQLKTSDRVTFKKYCREYAKKWIGVQKEELKEMGIVADYPHSYITMNKEYEASIITALATFIEKGHIERKGKTVPWCGHCKTVLANAEIEYKDRKDPSLYVLFPLADQDAQMIFPFAFEKNSALKINFLVWTTTPWTLPLNRAVVLNPSAEYVVLQGKEENQAIVVAKNLAEKVCALAQIPLHIIAECDAVVFGRKQVHHPFINGLMIPVILDESVLINEGTACLHSAPGCGPEDYMLGKKHGIEIYSPLAADGTYTHEIEPAALAGMPITDGQIWVIKELAARGTLFHKASITHSYPHCWRCRNGLMFRATDQWFCNLERNELVKKALEEIERITFIPDTGKARLHAFVSNRTEWCISRQRQWGVPIPALICNNCEWAFVNGDFVGKIAAHVAREGIEYWDRVTVQELVAQGHLAKTFSCGQCGNNDVTQFRQERDILDVWFDSGVSSYAVLAQNQENLGVPADLYLEGSDQHRGWFQSSLLCGMVLYGHAPMRQILTHGFIVDEQKRKMSKSLGNVVVPADVMKKYSRDILRLWVASCDYEGEVVMSEKLLANVAEVYRKIRNTCRFMLSNLYDFDRGRDAVAIEKMPYLDQYALARLHEVNNKIRRAYDEYRFATVVQLLNNYCTNDLSAVYLDILKDRLYTEKADGHLRRSAQTVLHHVLDTLTRLMAPILSFTAEEISDFYQKDKKTSLHLQDFPAVVDVWELLAQGEHAQAATRLASVSPEELTFPVRMQGLWAMLEEVRACVLKALEPQRQAEVIKHSLEAKVTLWFDHRIAEAAAFDAFVKALSAEGKESLNRFFKDWFIVSQVSFVAHHDSLTTTALPWLYVKAEHAEGVKCPRCWQWELSTHPQQLCVRCAALV